MFIKVRLNTLVTNKKGSLTTNYLCRMLKNHFMFAFIKQRIEAF